VSGPVILVLRLEAPAIVAAAFDTWLRDHVADVLQESGVHTATIHDEDAGPPDVIRRVVHYGCRDAEVAQTLAEHHPEWPEAGAQPRATGAVLLGRELLSPREDFSAGAPTTENCLNCGEVLTGQHCAYCGQRASVRVLSLWGLLRDVAGDLANWDARIWRTLRPLAFRPGFLTGEYLAGRRSAYTPPFRMYLILSLMFFLLAPLGAGLDLNTSSDRDAVDHPDVSLSAGARPSADDVEKTCNEDLRFGLDPLGMEWEPRVRQACERVLADPAGFGEAMLGNIPRTMFVFLPLLALIMQFLYIGSGRFYVEHLLFLVHVHSAFFLGALAVIVLQQGARISGPVGTAMDAVGGFGNAALVIYLPYYLYRAMRSVYGQARGWTLFKLMLLAIGYVSCLGLTVTALFVVTALER
jgi:hypothetical protein